MPGPSSRQPAPPTPPPPTSAQQQAALGYISAMPNAAHQADMAMINELVTQLAEVNAENRRKTQEVTEMCQRVTRQHDDWVAADPEMQRQMGVKMVTKAEYETLQALYKRSEDTRKQLMNTVEGLTEVQADYEEVMENTLVRVREFSHAHTDTLLKWHKHYNQNIQRLRDENLQLCLEHSQWQERLGKVNDHVRKAHSTMNELELPYLAKIAAVKRENKVLRRLANMPEKFWDSDDEREKEEEENEEAARIEAEIHRREADAIRTRDESGYDYESGTGGLAGLNEGGGNERL